MAVACGCGGGDAIRAVLPKVLVDCRCAGARCRRAQRHRRRHATAVVAASALAAATAHGADAPSAGSRAAAGLRARRKSSRIACAASRQLVDRFGCVVVLKGSGSIIAAPGVAPAINPTGNARLATAGTGDVLAGMVASRLAAGASAFEAAAGRRLCAWHWRRTTGRPASPLTAGALAPAPLTLAQPRPTKGILVAITVWNSTLASSGRLAM